MCPRLVIKRMAVRKQPSQRVVLQYNILRRVVFDNAFSKVIKRRKRNVQEWSKRMVCYLRRTFGAKEHVEEEFYAIVSKADMPLPPYEVSQQLKQQLDLLKSGKRTVPLMDKPQKQLQKYEVTQEKQIMSEEVNNSACNLHDLYQECHTIYSSTAEKTEVSCETHTTLSPQTGVNFLDMLMHKVKNANSSSMICLHETAQHEQEHSLSSNEEFLGFEERIEYPSAPALMLTPLVGQLDNKSAFVSQSLDDYLRENALEPTSANTSKISTVTLPKRQQQRPASPSEEGLVIPGCQPPLMVKPAVPESLLGLRTVAERRHYLQRHGRNYKLAIINNEAAIYRELQRRLRRQFQPLRHKCHAVLSAQSSNTLLPFTRAGWRAACFITTEVNKYYYQKLTLDQGRDCVRLPGVRGNNEKFYQNSYDSSPQKAASRCHRHCIDALLWRQLKCLETSYSKQRVKLISAPLQALFRACPLSQKPFQRPLDEETAALLLASGSMAIVRMPNVELEVFPEVGKPLHEVAKRYLQHILPHYDITREWAEFSVSTVKQGEQMVAEEECGELRSFTFAIPYLNDRSQILVRRVVDRSEALDKSFEITPSAADLSFRVNINSQDTELVTCADVVSDLINSAAISCSEDSFIKTDPDVLNVKDGATLVLKEYTPVVNKQETNTRAAHTQNKKQNRLL